MNTHTKVFFATDEPLDPICPHGKVLPMPKTREQRDAEMARFNGLFAFWFAVGYCAVVCAALAWLSARPQ